MPLASAAKASVTPSGFEPGEPSSGLGTLRLALPPVPDNVADVEPFIEDAGAASARPRIAVSLRGRPRGRGIRSAFRPRAIVALIGEGSPRSCSVRAGCFVQACPRQRQELVFN